MIVTVSRLIYNAIIGIYNAEGSLRTFPYVQLLTDLRTLEYSAEVLRNEISVSDYIEFIESRYDDYEDSWYENETIAEHIETLKYTGILPALDERQNTALEIILAAAGNIKRLMYHPKRDYLYAEALHIINLPMMLLENSGLVEYYLFVDKKEYTQYAHKRSTKSFEKLWKRMQKSMGDAVNGANHTMAMFEDSFEKVKNGTKTFEVRIFDDKRSIIKTGDTITIYNLSDINSTITVQVVSRARFDTFRQAYSEEQNMRVYGGTPEDDADSMTQKSYHLFSQEDEKKYGVVVFNIEIIEE